MAGNRKPRTYRDCEHCGERFHAKRLSQRFCSAPCKVAAQRGQTPWNAGKRCPQLDRAREGRCERCGAKYRARSDHARRRQRYCSRSCSAGAPGGSRLERAVREALSGAGFDFREQVRLGRYHADFVLGSLVVEADGAYWHDRPDVAARDRRRDAWLRAQGFEVLRLREDVIDSGPRAVVAQVSALASRD